MTTAGNSYHIPRFEIGKPGTQSLLYYALLGCFATVCAVAGVRGVFPLAILSIGGISRFTLLSLFTLGRGRLRSIASSLPFTLWLLFLAIFNATVLGSIIFGVMLILVLFVPLIASDWRDGRIDLGDDSVKVDWHFTRRVIPYSRIGVVRRVMHGQLWRPQQAEPTLELQARPGTHFGIWPWSRTLNLNVPPDTVDDFIANLRSRIPD